MKLAALSDDFVWSSLQSTDSVGSPPKMEGRTIYYHVAEDNGDVDDENVQGYSLVFNVNDVEQLTCKFAEETGLDGVIVCNQSPLNGKLYSSFASSSKQCYHAGCFGPSLLKR
ncbi:hypothetical protein MtrunA17_Chr8g0363091 [Medicago truncatula]|uniref:Uncharacterized protein n=1 Tax=Medicago truncatula TaxID=3880 RepID=A0A396GJ78_MEDTR|nr:hypothetical protein MtrunA17_Chr8g0363091 [Medicago truncatula]